MTSSLADIVDRRRAALVVVDVQNDFVESQTSACAAEILPRLKQMLTAARKVGVKIVYTQAFVSDQTSSDVWRSGLSKRPHGAAFCRQGSRGSEIHSEVTPLAGDIVIPKYRYSAFIGTNLEVILRAHEVKSLIFTGLATNVCVESSVRDAYQRDYWTVMVSDCTAASAPELHHASLRSIERNFGLVATSGEILRVWERD
jgi:ureidoacrylate peracid hydrolase